MTEMKPRWKVSILIDNYNYGQYVGQAIESALAQSYPDIDVVVVDDGSTDESAKIIRSYGDRICAVFKENGGQASAFNTGFTHCKGEIIMLLDADDYLHPEAAAKIAASWKPESGALHHRLCTVDADGTETGFGPPKSLSLDSGDVVGLMLKEGIHYNCPATSGRAFSRKILEIVLPIPEKEFRVCADAYLQIAIPFVTPISVLDETLAYYRVHSTNACATALRRAMTRERLLKRCHYYDVTWRAAQELVGKRNLVMTDPNLCRCYDELFERLLIARSDPEGMSIKSRIQKMVQLVWKLSSEHSRTLGNKIRQAFLVGIVCFAPRGILAKYYVCMRKTPDS